MPVKLIFLSLLLNLTKLPGRILPTLVTLVDVFFANFEIIFLYFLFELNKIWKSSPLEKMLKKFIFFLKVNFLVLLDMGKVRKSKFAAHLLALQMLVKSFKIPSEISIEEVANLWRYFENLYGRFGFSYIFIK